MTKVTKEVKERTVTRESIRCDLCGMESGSSSWTDDGTIGTARASWTCRYDGCYDDSDAADFCLDCWKDKIKPALQAIGVKFT